MDGMRNFITFSIFFMFSFFGCATTQPKIPMDWASSQPGTQVSFRGNPVKLLGSPISVGKPLLSVEVVDKEGIVRYIQVVPESSHLPDMEKAFEKAMELAK